MQQLQPITEYYDELYPVTSDHLEFYKQILKDYPAPQKVLNIGIGTGSFEFSLSKAGYDVTGLEVIQCLLESALLKRRNQLLSLRFFKLSSTEMTKFLGHGFFNVISCLNNKIVFFKNKTLVQNFFSDSYKLLSPNGTLILHLYNHENCINSKTFSLPVKSSLRIQLFSQIQNISGISYLTQYLKKDTGHPTTIIQDEQIFPLTQNQIKDFAASAGFKSVELFADCQWSPLTADSKEIFAIIKK